MSALPDDALLAAIRLGNTGQHYTIWNVIGSRKATSQICWTLIGILESDREYLDRYHCAAALIRLLGATEMEPVHLSAGGEARIRNIERIRILVQQRVGPRPASGPSA